MVSLVYDIETFPNTFTCSFSDGSVFEISWRKNEVNELIEFMGHLTEMIGFNNVSFDYPVMDFIIQNRNDIGPEKIYGKVESIISTPFNDRFQHRIWPKNRCVPQMDLMLIHHFDNVNRATSLKALEFAMRSEKVLDLPFPLGKYLTSDEIDTLIEYNKYDVEQTEKFLARSQSKIRFRREVSKMLSGDVLNFSDIKIGTQYFISKLGLNGQGYSGDVTQTPRKPPFKAMKFPKVEHLDQDAVDVYNIGLPVEFHLPDKPEREDHEETANQKSIDKWIKECEKKHKLNLTAIWVPVKEILFDYISFSHLALSKVLNFFSTLNITHTKDAFHFVSSVGGVELHFGAGGVHGSISNKIVHSTEDKVVRDIDATSYYANVAIKNGLKPEHLPDSFCQIFSGMDSDRQEYDKGTAINSILKQAMVGVFGNSKNKYSPFLDPQYTMTVTINGQLLICMLLDLLLCHKDVELIQANTDGLTIRHPRHLTGWVEDVEGWWTKLTRIELESVIYKSIYIRDVGSYIALFDDGKVKRKGAYIYDVSSGELDWNKSHSTLVVRKAAEAFLVDGKSIEEFVKHHDDIYDFMMLGKANRGCSLALVDASGNEETQSQIMRFYISTNGRHLMKHMPPLARTPDKKRVNCYQGTKGWLVTECNDMSSFAGGIDYSYYIEKAHKLVDGMTVME